MRAVSGSAVAQVTGNPETCISNEPSNLGPVKPCGGFRAHFRSGGVFMCPDSAHYTVCSSSVEDPGQSPHDLDNVSYLLDSVPNATPNAVTWRTIREHKGSTSGRPAGGACKPHSSNLLSGRSSGASWGRLGKFSREMQYPANQVIGVKPLLCDSTHRASNDWWGLIASRDEFLENEIGSAGSIPGSRPKRKMTI